MRRRILHVIAALVGGVALIAALIGIQIYLGNDHAVIEGELYRAAQPTPRDIERYARDYGIKSILNLRGENVGSPWYDAEAASAKTLGITHLNFRMKASRELTDAQAKALIEMMRTAPKPLLIHCRSGSDRTGLAAALYLAAIRHEDEPQASQQLSLRYGHVPLWFTDAYAMDRSFARLVPQLAH